VKVALVGCGTAAEYYHLPALLVEVGANRLWFVDANFARARALADAAGAPRHHALAEAKAVVGQVDAAIVAVPTHLHAEIASELLREGIHVLCEKPLATTVADARALVAVAGSALLATAHFRRFFPTTQLVADLLARELCGRPRRFAAEEGSVQAWEPQSDYWLDRRRAGGGVLADLGPHVLDLIRTWVGDVEAVSYQDDSFGGVEADCVLELSGQVPGTVELSRTRVLRNVIRFECDRGSIVAPLPRAGEVMIEIDGRVHEVVAGGADAYPAAFRAQLVDFLSAAREGRRPTVDGRDGMAVLEVIEAAYARREPLPQPWVTETA
jgi:predicted dehydrogenase